MKIIKDNIGKEVYNLNNDPHLIRVLYNSNLIKHNGTIESSWNSITWRENFKKTSYIKFKFKGNYLRLLGRRASGRGEDILITIDGDTFRFNQSSPTIRHFAIDFEIDGLYGYEHDVIIQGSSNSSGSTYFFIGYDYLKDEFIKTNNLYIIDYYKNIYKSDKNKIIALNSLNPSIDKKDIWEDLNKNKIKDTITSIGISNEFYSLPFINHKFINSIKIK